MVIFDICPACASKWDQELRLSNCGNCGCPLGYSEIDIVVPPKPVLLEMYSYHSFLDGFKFIFVYKDGSKQNVTIPYWKIVTCDPYYYKAEDFIIEELLKATGLEPEILYKIRDAKSEPCEFGGWFKKIVYG